MKWKAPALSMFFSTLLLTGCSASWHLQRAVKKDPSLLQTQVIKITDTLVTPPILLRDTVSFFKTDTVTVQKDKLVIKIKRISDSEFSIDAEVKADTIVRFIEVPIETVVYKEKTMLEKLYAFSFWGALATIVVMLIMNKLWRNR